MKKLIINICISACCCININLYSQENKILSIQQMHEDIEYYLSKAKIWEENPLNPYVNLNTDSLKRELEKHFQNPMNRDEFNFLLAKTNKYFDGHTKVYFQSSYNIESKIFPWIKLQEGYIMLDNYRVININHVDGKRLASDLDKLVSWEYHDKAKEKEINRRFTFILNKYYSVLPPYTCRLENIHTGEMKDSVVFTLSVEGLNKLLLRNKCEKHFSPLDHIYFPEESIAILYYNDSNLPDESSKKEYESYLADFFNHVENAGIKYLFIDVSRNGGGSDFTHEYIYKYLKNEPYTTFNSFYFNKESPLEWLNWIKEFIKNESPDMTEAEVEEYLNSHEEAALMMNTIYEGKNTYTLTKKAKRCGYQGQVFIIMGNSTYSSAYSFCDVMKRGKAGILVGEEPMQREPFAGDLRSDYLPNSKLPFCYSSVFSLTEPFITNEEGFLIPDIPYSLERCLELGDFKKIISLYKETKK